MCSRLIRLVPFAAVAAAFLSTSSLASAQGMSVGIQGGVNFSNVDFKANTLTFSFDRRTGGVGGLFFADDFNKNMGLQVDVLFSQKGTKATMPFEPGALEIRVDYLEIPVLLRVNVPNANGSVVFRVFGGPSFAAKLRDQQLFDGDELPADEKADLKSYDIGFTVGGALELGKRFVVDGRYTFGLVNIDDDPEDLAEDVSIKSKTFTVMVGLRFK